MLHKKVSLFNHKMIMNEPIPEADKHRLVESILFRCKSQDDNSNVWSKQAATHYRGTAGKKIKMKLLSCLSERKIDWLI